MKLQQLTEMFGAPVSNRRLAWWAKAPELVAQAIRVLQSSGANPWVFAADGRHFAQFAEPEDWVALWALSDQEQEALLGWSEWDWEELFRY